jgi:meiotically up-regulated gene 157 (Mug157) protein
MFVAVIASSIIWFKRDDVTIRASSPAFLVGVAIGIVSDLIGIIIQEGRPTDSACKARFIIPSMSLTIILANLFVKT